MVVKELESNLSSMGMFFSIQIRRRSVIDVVGVNRSILLHRPFNLYHLICDESQKRDNDQANPRNSKRWPKEYEILPSPGLIDDN